MNKKTMKIVLGVIFTLFIIAWIYIKSTSPNIDELVKQCDNGNDISCNSLGAIYAVDIKLEQDYFKIPKYLDPICKREWEGISMNNGQKRRFGNLACYWENAYYKLMSLELKQNYFKAVKYFQKGCDKDNNSSCSNLKEMYLSGRGTKQYDNELVLYYQERCNSNNASACFNLGILYKGYNGKDIWGQMKMISKGIVGYPADKNKAKRLFSKACNLKEVLGCDEYNNMQ
jgi:hypothetical protein